MKQVEQGRPLSGERQVLELLARNAPLDETLTVLVRKIEEQAGEMICSVLLLERGGSRLRCGAAPGLPDSCRQEMESLTIDEAARACGVGVFSRSRVVCHDLSGDLSWPQFREIALRHHLHACWFSPIFSVSGEMLGTFACFFRVPRSPREREIRLVEGMVYLAQMAIERQRASEERAESDRRLRLLNDNATEVIMAYDMDRRLIYVNSVVTAQRGYTVQELREKNFINWLHPEDSPRMMELWERLYQGEGYSGVEFRVLCKDGTLRWILGCWNPLLDENGRQIGVQGREIDITERKKLEEQLRQSHKMEAIGRLAGGVAHDFNNLLTAIIGHSELILAQVDEANPLRAEVEEIKRAGERAALLTRQLLAFSRKQVLMPVILNLNDMLDNMSRMLRRLIREDIRLVTQGRSALWLVRADPGQMQQIILNLALNARDAMPEGGSLTLKVANVTLDEAQAQARSPMKAGQYVKLSVSDTGEGMDESTRSRIFEPFFTTKELGKGTGLGLSTVYGIVKQSEGFIWVESQVSKGTTFEIYLPKTDESADLPRAQMLPPSPVSDLRTILVVEDDDSVRRPVRRMLEMSGYVVLEARNPDEALKMARQERGKIDLVLTDMVMPRMSGRELASRMAEFNRDVRVLYMSGHIEDADVIETAAGEGADFIPKPFSGAALKQKVHEMLGRPKA
jgi:two-component system cell cycle sensor histidine kinase/response regulator CckA